MLPHLTRQMAAPGKASHKGQLPLTKCQSLSCKVCPHKSPVRNTAGSQPEISKIHWNPGATLQYVAGPRTTVPFAAVVPSITFEIPKSPAFGGATCWLSAHDGAKIAVDHNHNTNRRTPWVAMSKYQKSNKQKRNTSTVWSYLCITCLHHENILRLDVTLGKQKATADNSTIRMTKQKPPTKKRQHLKPSKAKRSEKKKHIWNIRIKHCRGER